MVAFFSRKWFETVNFWSSGETPVTETTSKPIQKSVREHLFESNRSGPCPNVSLIVTPLQLVDRISHKPHKEPQSKLIWSSFIFRLFVYDLVTLTKMTSRHATSTKDYTSKEDDEHGSNQNVAFVAHDSFVNTNRHDYTRAFYDNQSDRT
jgi:hypothetical protein